MPSFGSTKEVTPKPNPGKPSEGGPKRGLSLTQEAIRQLRKNRVAMASFWTLVAVGLLSFFSPLFPMQPPDKVFTDQKFSEPSWLLQEPAKGTAEQEEEPIDRSLFIKTFSLDAERIADQGERVEAAEADLAEARRAYRESRGEERDEAIRQLRRQKNRVEDIVQRPYRDAGFPVLGPLSRAMVRARYALFGEWSINAICGRDKLGRDIFSRIFWGSRVSLIVGLVATIVSVVIGVTYGAIAGYTGGWVDGAMMRLVDVLYSVPFIFVVIFVISILDDPQIRAWREEYGLSRIVIFYLVVGAIYWLTMARVVRGQVISLRNEPFVESARAIGVTHAGIVFRHIVPNLLSVVIVYLTLTIPRVILFEAFLSFLGLGVEPPDVSWGLLANEGIQVITPVKVYWWLIVFPSGAIGITLFALNFLGDGLRDAFDPRLRDQ
ncbi:Oligopeptide transport system permease protein OppC [Posidoniimonas polymericola]|uniref:Oligopeptide transport system permease protein OppC n=1 Tax=Posidoniimonas polymericola TaxID=2528002 RepID=A0A5C5ZDL1_9BACT|nr:ABC transporter permease [Posidoniimonas polymericola]TWT85258.1 Oligopeptide transport system permease protein OppC [Posidoniimonas polymericola]